MTAEMLYINYRKLLAEFWGGVSQTSLEGKDIISSSERELMMPAFMFGEVLSIIVIVVSLLSRILL